MRYEIKGNNLPYVEIFLNKDETLHTEQGAMSWMSDTLIMKTNAGGSLGNAFSRVFSGESMFQNTYTASKDDDFIAVSSCFPGEILAIDVGEKPLIAQKRAFLAREQSVNMSIFFQRKIGTAFFGGEGLFNTKVTGPGKVWIQSAPLNKIASLFINK